MDIQLRAGTNTVDAVVRLKKGTEMVIIKEGHDMEINPAKLPKVIDGKLMCEGLNLMSVAELAASIYLAGYEKASRDMTFAIMSLMSGEMKSVMFIDAYRHVPGFEFLDDLVLSDFIDEGECREYILDRLDDVLYDEYEIDSKDSIFRGLIRFAATYPRMNELKNVEISVSIDRYGSGITIYRNRLNSVPGIGGFHAVDEDDPRYDDEYDKWEALIKEYVFPETKTLIFGADDVGELVERALSTGNIFELLPKSVRVTETYKIDLAALDLHR